jgi:hypothetical protein
MTESIKIAMIVLPPFLIGGGLIFLTWRNQKRQLFILIPILVCVDVWLGFSHGWKTADFVQLGIILLSGIVGSFMVFQTPAKK